MTDTRYVEQVVERQSRGDGTVLLRSRVPLGPVAARTSDWLHHWAESSPDRVFLAERSGDGWREVAYGAALDRVRALGAALLGRGLGQDTPVMILSGNGIDHALLTLAGQYVGVPTVPVAEQYSLIADARDRLIHVAGLVQPKMVFAVDAGQFSEALALDIFDGVEVVASRPGATGATDFDILCKTLAGPEVDAARDAVGPDTLAKILMTSGSTSSPKGVMTTQGMMCVNQAQLLATLPFLGQRPPRILDWLPWNHVFGGSHNFNMMLANGGSLYIDDGKPVRGPLFDRTLQNMGMISGTAQFNVPVGFQLQAEALEADADLRKRFFADLDLVFYAGATLPRPVWEAFGRMARAETGRVPLITTSWGLTETAPACLLQHQPSDRAGRIGVPMPDTVAKLIPIDAGRYEIRVKGPNIMPGYYRDGDKTAAAFDAEGYFITGDAVKLIDPADPAQGVSFEGRVSEDFKLLTGTWVRAATLRLECLAALAPLAADLVVTGQDRGQVGLLIFPNLEALVAEGIEIEECDGFLTGADLASAVAGRLNTRAGQRAGSSERIARVAVLAEPPSVAGAEITAKGSLNITRVLDRRALLLTRLYDDEEPAVIRP